MFEFYHSGKDFFNDNVSILKQYPLETVFFELNSQLISQTDDNDFLIKIDKNGKTLIAVHLADYPMDVFGDNELCADFARIAAERKLIFDKVLGARDTCETFLNEYRKFVRCEYKVSHAMDIMSCDKPKTDNTDGVEWATENDVDELTDYVASFNSEAMGESVSIEKCKRRVSGNIRNFAVLRKDGKILSFASKTRETEFLTAVSHVYTAPQYRNCGLSCKVVTFLTKSITENGKLAYLFVDKNNPISNHLYGKIGYSYAAPQYEFKIIFD